MLFEAELQTKTFFSLEQYFNTDGSLREVSGETSLGNIKRQFFLVIVCNRGGIINFM